MANGGESGKQLFDSHIWKHRGTDLSNDSDISPDDNNCPAHAENFFLEHLELLTSRIRAAVEKWQHTPRILNIKKRKRFNATVRNFQIDQGAQIRGRIPKRQKLKIYMPEVMSEKWRARRREEEEEGGTVDRWDGKARPNVGEFYWVRNSYFFRNGRFGTLFDGSMKAFGKLGIF